MQHAMQNRTFLLSPGSFHQDDRQLSMTCQRGLYASQRGLQTYWEYVRTRSCCRRRPSCLYLTLTKRVAQKPVSPPAVHFAGLPYISRHLAHTGELFIVL